MAFALFQDVILTADVAKHDLRAGDIGTIVENHRVPGREDGYSVEFFDMTGRTVAVVLLPISYLRVPTPSDRPTVRAPAAVA